MNFPFYRRSVASITSTLGRMVDDLKAHAEAKIAEREKHGEVVHKHRALAKDAQDEATKALAAAEKIGNLFSAT